MSAKRSPLTRPVRSLAEPPASPVARTSRHVLRSSTVGAMPLLDAFLRRMRRGDFLRSVLPPEDLRTKLSPVKALLVLLRNLLVARGAIYGVGEGRTLDRLFAVDVPSLGQAVAPPIVRECDVSLAELHNDSTTVTADGAVPHYGRQLAAPGRFGEDQTQMCGKWVEWAGSLRMQSHLPKGIVRTAADAAPHGS